MIWLCIHSPIGYLHRCFCHRAQTRLLLGIAFVLSLAVVTVEFCVMTAEVR